MVSWHTGWGRVACVGSGRKAHSLTTPNRNRMLTSTDNHCQETWHRACIHSAPGMLRQRRTEGGNRSVPARRGSPIFGDHESAGLVVLDMPTNHLMLRTTLLLRYFAADDAGCYEEANSLHASLLSLGFDLAA